MEFEELFEINKGTAELIHIKVGTLRQYVSRGIIPALYIGSRRLIKASVIARICREGLKTN